MNFVSNAFKFTNSGGIIVRVKKRDQQTIRFEVEDTGGGIPENKATMLFEAFTQIGKNDQKVGTGLGLSISKELCQLLGGNCTASNNEYNGVTFSFEVVLPISMEEKVENEGDPNTFLCVVGGNQFQVNHLDRLFSSAHINADFFSDIKSRSPEFENYSHVIINDYDISIDHLNIYHELEKENKSQTTSVVFLSSFTGQYSEIKQPLHHTQLLMRVLGTETKKPEDHPVALSGLSGALVVDDDPTSRMILQRYLSGLGMEVECAVDGVDALKKALPSHNFDIIFMDTQMPQMDGIETAKLIWESGDEVWIISLSGESEEEKKTLWLEMGVNDYLVKPLDCPSLKQVIMKEKTT